MHPEKPINRSERLHDIDALRAILMALGIVLHSSNIFNERNWLINSSETHSFYTFLSPFIHDFRMPVFFMISGLFIGLSFVRRRLGDTFPARLKRLTLPLLTIALTLNVLEFYVVNTFNGTQPSWTNFFLQGQWMSHLWFLVNLTAYTLTLWLIYYYLIRTERMDSVIAWLRSMRLPLPALMLTFPLFHIGILTLSPLGIPIYYQPFGLLSIHGYLFYFQFLMLGFVVGCNESIRAAFIELNTKWMAASLLIVFALYSLDLSALSNTPKQIATAYVDILKVLLIAYVLCTSFHALFKEKSASLSQISEASYTIYLLHHSLVIILGIAAIELGLNAHAGFFLVTALTFFVTLRIHKSIISKTPLLSLFINGKTIDSQIQPRPATAK